MATVVVTVNGGIDGGEGIIDMRRSNSDSNLDSEIDGNNNNENHSSNLVEDEIEKDKRAN